MIFVWDNIKNQANKKKHGVSFEEAQTVFYDNAANVYKENDEVIRIISARKATKHEQAKYKR